jgi:ATP adenylyltransferase
VTLERLWAGWRSDYIGSMATGAATSRPCLFCALAAAPPGDAQILAREDHVFAVLNAYPYTSGHLMVAPVRHEAELDGLDREEADALMRMMQVATTAVRAAFRPDGLNVGLNIGRAAGAGIPGHLHVHVVPRWSGDTNFMTSVAEVRVLPEPLDVTGDKLRAAWPG